MSEDLRRKANEAYQAELKRLEGDKKPKGEIAEMQAQTLGSINLGGNFCDVAPQTIQSLIKVIRQFSWFIPDNIEKPGLAVLRALQVVLPEFCAGDAEKKAGEAKPEVKQNFNTKE